jgi:hypothetical protein|tara:strand:+ start:2405 stop:2518 length:114 start_codon:yes stop_codon:yes gene_type:complete
MGFAMSVLEVFAFVGVVGTLIFANVLFPPLDDQFAQT